MHTLCLLLTIINGTVGAQEELSKLLKLQRLFHPAIMSLLAYKIFLHVANVGHTHYFTEDYMSNIQSRLRANVAAYEKVNSYARDGWIIRLVGITGTMYERVCTH